jgi:tRNA(Ile)-lysidine synthetase-like protein
MSTKTWLVAVHLLAVAGAGAGFKLIIQNRDRRRGETASRIWEEVLNFWFYGAGAASWFLLEGPQRDAFDARVREKFITVIEDCESGANDWWFDARPLDYRGALALILVLDQFTRHVYRNDEGRVARAGVRARDFTRRSLLRGDHQRVRGDELGFLLMPYRHAKPVDMKLLDEVLAIVDEREQRALAEKAALSRFKRVTESRMSEARAEYEKTNASTWRTYRDEEIVEPVAPPSSLLLSKLTEDSRGPVWKVLEKYLDRQHKAMQHCIVSLSGGVDSMVLMTILVSLIARRKLEIVLVAAHVDYGNRAESHAEADFVRRYSEGLGVNCHVKKIEGLLRGVTDREEYEAKSREIRFDLYKTVWYDELGATGPPIVLFGHHEGDVVENVLSNAMKGKTILELSGMTEESHLSGCRVQRPLLPLIKEHIFEYAHRFGVPYFKDSTPRWSTRGQVRLEVLPCLERVYGKGFQGHLARLAEQSDDAYALLSKDFFRGRVVSSDSLKLARNLPLAFAFDLTTEMDSKPLFMWRLALRKSAHDHGVLVATDKAVKFIFDSAVARQRAKSKGGWFAELRKGSRGYVWDNQYLLVFRFEPDVIVPYDTTRQANLFLKEGASPVRFGYWEVSVARTQAPCSTITMTDLWKMLVVDPRDSFRVNYLAEPSENGIYKLSKSSQLIPGLDVDLQLRGGLIPQVFPCERCSKVTHTALVTVHWIGQNFVDS